MLIPMQIDANGLIHLRAFEGCRLTAYFDVSEYAIGYGHHGPNINDATMCTPDQAEMYLAEDTHALSNALSKAITTQLNQGQFNVMVIFAYNVGVNAFKGSHLLARLNGGNIDSVPSELARWIYSNGTIDSALQTRRSDEIALWELASQTQNQTSN